MPNLSQFSNVSGFGSLVVFQEHLKFTGVWVADRHGPNELHTS